MFWNSPTKAKDEIQNLFDVITNKENITESGNVEMCNKFSLITNEKLPFLDQSINVSFNELVKQLSNQKILLPLNLEAKENNPFQQLNFVGIELSLSKYINTNSNLIDFINSQAGKSNIGASSSLTVNKSPLKFQQLPLTNRQSNITSATAPKEIQIKNLKSKRTFFDMSSNEVGTDVSVIGCRSIKNLKSNSNKDGIKNGHCEAQQLHILSQKDYSAHLKNKYLILDKPKMDQKSDCVQSADADTVYSKKESDISYGFDGQQLHVVDEKNSHNKSFQVDRTQHTSTLNLESCNLSHSVSKNNKIEKEVPCMILSEKQHINISEQATSNKINTDDYMIYNTDEIDVQTLNNDELLGNVDDELLVYLSDDEYEEVVRASSHGDTDILTESFLNMSVIDIDPDQSPQESNSFIKELENKLVENENAGLEYLEILEIHLEDEDKNFESEIDDVNESCVAKLPSTNLQMEKELTQTLKTEMPKIASPLLLKVNSLENIKTFLNEETAANEAKSCKQNDPNENKLKEHNIEIIKLPSYSKKGLCDVLEVKNVDLNEAVECLKHIQNENDKPVSQLVLPSSDAERFSSEEAIGSLKANESSNKAMVGANSIQIENDVNKAPLSKISLPSSSSSVEKINCNAIGFQSADDVSKEVKQNYQTIPKKSSIMSTSPCAKRNLQGSIVLQNIDQASSEVNGYLNDIQNNKELKKETSSKVLPPLSGAGKGTQETNNENIKQYNLPFVSSNQKENEDNNDPNWNFLRNLKTDEQRYLAVRKLWKTVVVPDPNMNLTYHGYRRKVQGKSSSEFVELLQKPPFGRMNMKRGRENDDLDVQPSSKKQKCFQDLHFNEKAVDRTIQLVTQDYHDEINSSYKNKNFAKKLEKKYDDYMKQLNFARSEAEALHKFYCGLPDQKYSTQQEIEQEQWDIEQVYNMFKNFYRWDGKAFNHCVL